MQIEGTIALVTGANRGIGKAFADALLERGAAKVYAAVRDVATVSDADPRLVPVQLDVTDADRVAAVAQELGDVELVVNNAGIGHPGDPAERRARRRPRRARGQLPRPDRHDAGLRAGPRGQRRRRVRQRPVGRVVGRQPDPVDLLGVEVRGLELHELRTRRAQAPGHARRRRPRRLRRHRPHRRARRATRSRRPPWPPRRSTPSRPASPRRSSTTSAARSRPASATTSAPCTRRSSWTSRRSSGPRT